MATIVDPDRTDPTGPRKGLRGRKIRAVLAAGLVLGIGAVVTLAAWNDSEYATGTFAAGTFNLEGSTDGTTYADHASGASAAIRLEWRDMGEVLPINQ